MPITKLQPFNLDATANYTFGTVTATNFVGNGSQLTGIVPGTTVPTVTAITYPGDDTAADTAGGQTITITGTGFASGATVIINGVTASVVSVVNSTTITFTAPAITAGSYVVYVVNTNGTTALLVPGIQYSGTPTWTTAAGSLGTTIKQAGFTANLITIGDAPITYSLTTGTLPSGVTLNANTGVISGTTPNVSSDTTYNFTVRATDAQRQDTDRAFSLTVAAGMLIEYLIVAGGGGGGQGRGGGGGAGGMLTGNTIVAGSVTVTVGAGGAGGTLSSGVLLAAAANGNNSTALGLTAIGGGGGALSVGAGGQSLATYTGRSGGSGGGAGSNYFSYNAPAGAGTPGQGNAGGLGYTGGEPYNGGSGGGAGAVGSAAVNAVGGIGLQSSITGSATYYAGGGGSGSYGGGPNSGGAGGGGAGGVTNAAGTAGTVNTGGGGGGGGNAGEGGAGGAGVVVVRYADTNVAASSTTGSPTITVTGGFRVYKFTTSGSITF